MELSVIAFGGIVVCGLSQDEASRRVAVAYDGSKLLVFGSQGEAEAMQSRPQTLHRGLRQNAQ